MRRILAYIAYNIVWIIGRPLFSLFLHYKVIHPERIASLRGPLIIASNHISFLDAFLLSGAFPLFSRIFPIRFIIAADYYYHPLFFIPVWIWGHLPVKKGIGPENTLKTALNILKGDGTIGVFPQGGIYRGGRPKNGRRGISYLATKSGAPILPIRIDGAFHLDVKRFFSRKAKITITIGKIFSIPTEKTYPENAKEISDLIMRSIKAL